jgi:hypothetical protein
MENTHAQQVELGASVHLPLEKLESIDLPLDLAAAPLRREGRAHRRQIGFEARRESPQLGHRAIAGLDQPAIEATDVATVDQAKKVTCQTARNGDRRFDASQRFDEAPLVAALLLGRFSAVPADQPRIGLAVTTGKLRCELRAELPLQKRLA